MRRAAFVTSAFAVLAGGCDGASGGAAGGGGATGVASTGSGRSTDASGGTGGLGNTGGGGNTMSSSSTGGFGGVGGHGGATTASGGLGGGGGPATTSTGPTVTSSSGGLGGSSATATSSAGSGGFGGLSDVGSTSSTTGGVGGATGSSSSGDATSGAGGLGSSEPAGSGGASQAGLPWTRNFSTLETDPPYAFGIVPAGVAVGANEDITIQFGLGGSVDLGGGPIASLGRASVGLARFDIAGNYLGSKVFLHTDNLGPRFTFNDGLGNFFLIGAIASEATNLGPQDFGGPPLSAAPVNSPYVVKVDDQGNHVWSTAYAPVSGSAHHNYVEDAAVDPAHDLVLAGSFSDTMDFGTGPVPTDGIGDALIVKIGNDGGAIWTKQFGGDSLQEATSVATDATGNVFAAGDNHGTIEFGDGTSMTAVSAISSWLVKLDENGALVWSRGFNGTDQTQQGPFATSVAINSLGDVLVAGNLEGDCDFGAGLVSADPAGSAFLAKYDSQGTYLWGRLYPVHFLSPRLHVMANDDIMLTSYVGSTSSADLGCGAVAAHLDSSLVARLASDGSCIWSRAVNATNVIDIGSLVSAGPSAQVFAGYVLQSDVALDAFFGGAQYHDPAGSLLLGAFEP